MTEKHVTDEELWEKHSNPNWMDKVSFMKAISEDRKGMFTGEDIKEAYNAGGHDMMLTYEQGIYAPHVTADQYLTERKGR